MICRRCKDKGSWIEIAVVGTGYAGRSTMTYRTEYCTCQIGKDRKASLFRALNPLRDFIPDGTLNLPRTHRGEGSGSAEETG